MSEQAVDLTIRKAITVRSSQERAFAVFCEQMGSWWPLADKSIGTAKAETAVVEPRAGGRWYERGIDGSECEWGRVLVYDPPSRLLLDWQISAEWSYDPALHTELEVRFFAEDGQHTRVELEHRGLADAYGAGAHQMHAIFDSPGGWTGILTGYAEAART